MGSCSGLGQFLFSRMGSAAQLCSASSCCPIPVVLGQGQVQQKCIELQSGVRDRCQSDRYSERDCAPVLPCGKQLHCVSLLLYILSLL